MPGKRIGRHISGGPTPEMGGEDRGEVRDAFARWASGVSIVAVRSDGRVHALTVSAFMPLSLEPPSVVVSLGPNASAAPYLKEGSEFGISILRADQRALASRYADTFPAGPSPFTADDPPLIQGAAAGLVCEVQEILPRADHRLVVAAVREIKEGADTPVLVYWGRGYHGIG